MFPDPIPMATAKTSANKYCRSANVLNTSMLPKTSTWTLFKLVPQYIILHYILKKNV